MSDQQMQMLELLTTLRSCVRALEAQTDNEFAAAKRKLYMQWLLVCQAGEVTVIAELSRLLLGLLPEKRPNLPVATTIVEFVNNRHVEACHCDECCPHCREKRKSSKRGGTCCCSCPCCRPRNMCESRGTTTSRQWSETTTEGVTRGVSQSESQGYGYGHSEGETR